MSRVFFQPEWLQFPQHPAFWFDFTNEDNTEVNTTDITEKQSSVFVPWETTQLNLTQDKSTFDYTYIHTDNPPKFAAFDFEIYDWKSWAVFGTHNWHLPFIAGIIYLGVIFGLQKYMQNREALNLKWPLFLWNSALGLFSVIGFIRTAPEFFSILLGTDGFYKGICFRDGGNYPLGYWSLLFVLSKYVELGDSVFIVLRKRPLVFIQWYHHFVTMIMAWLSAPYVEAIGRWYVVMNYGVHSMMYPYFAFRGLGFKIPRKISTTITTCQLGQMLTGLFVNFFTAFLIQLGIPCYRHPFSIKLSAFVYGTFTILFGKLFCDIVYRNQQKKSKAE